MDHADFVKLIKKTASDSYEDAVRRFSVSRLEEIKKKWPRHYLSEDLNSDLSWLIESLEDAVKCLSFYGNAHMYELTSFVTEAPIREVGVPSNIEVQGNPVDHDHGKRAKECLARIEEEK